MRSKNKGKFSGGGSFDSRRRGLLIAIGICAVLLAAAILMLLFLMNREPVAGPVETVPTTEGIQTSAPPVPTETTEPMQTTVPETSVPPTETTAPPETTVPVETTKPYNPGPVTPPPTSPPPTQPPKVLITLPYTIPGSTLFIQRVAGFDGVFLEDGSDSQINGVAMMLLQNVGMQAIEYAKITMTYDDKVLTFEVSALEPGGIVAVQEIGRNSCAAGDLLSCTADIAAVDSLGMAADQVSIQDNGDNTLTVTNLTDSEIVTVRVFYKYYMAEENVYVGGITFTAKISNLKANESVVINPSHYASGASKVVMIRTYDTDA